jgi:protein O-GlcNAc transferase
LEYYQRAFDIDSKYVPAINGIGYLYMKIEQYDNAEEWFKKLIKIRPDLASPYNSYANVLIQKEQFDEAIVYYKKAMEKDEFFYYPIRRIANIYVNKKNYDEARKYFRKYVEVSTQLNSKYLAFLNIANTYLYEGNKESALKAFDEYIELATQNNMPFYEIWGNIYQGYIITCCGDPQEGLKYYEKVAGMIDKSDLSEEQKNEHRINISMMKSTAYIISEDFQNSESELKNCKNLVATLESDFLDDMINMIYAYQDIKQNNYEAALSKLDDIKAKHVLVTYYSALANDLKGDKEQAKKYYSKLMNNKESNLHIALRYKEIEDKLAK